MIPVAAEPGFAARRLAEQARAVAADENDDEAETETMDLDG